MYRNLYCICFTSEAIFLCKLGPLSYSSAPPPSSEAMSPPHYVCVAWEQEVGVMASVRSKSHGETCKEVGGNGFCAKQKPW